MSPMEKHECTHLCFEVKSKLMRRCHKPTFRIPVISFSSKSMAVACSSWTIPTKYYCHDLWNHKLGQNSLFDMVIEFTPPNLGENGAN